MSCNMAEYLSTAGPVYTMDDGYNSSVLQVLGFDTSDAFRSYSQQHANPNYISDNGQYYPCEARGVQTKQ